MREELRRSVTYGLIALALFLPISLRGQVRWKNPLKEALKAGKPVMGLTVTVGHAEIAATLGIAGFDFLWFEMEHTPMGLDNLREMILATRGLRAIPITRVPYNEPWLVKRVLDAGSLGVIFPFTSSRELAEKAVKACKYPPTGIRGFGPGLVLSRWNVDMPSYIKFANENIIVIVMIEDQEGVDNIDQIASVPGIDVLAIGPADLSFSLGVGGQFNHPLVEEAIGKVLAAGKSTISSWAFRAAPRRWSTSVSEKDSVSSRTPLTLTCCNRLPKNY